MFVYLCLGYLDIFFLCFCLCCFCACLFDWLVGWRVDELAGRLVCLCFCVCLFDWFVCKLVGLVGHFASACLFMFYVACCCHCLRFMFSVFVRSYVGLHLGFVCLLLCLSSIAYVVSLPSWLCSFVVCFCVCCLFVCLSITLMRLSFLCLFVVCLCVCLFLLFVS